jgi:hypothetical protein
MSETYQSKRERWQRLLDSLPADLRNHVSLRNVEAVAALSPQAQTRLTEAIQAGLKRLPRAIEQLRIKPDTSVTELLNPPTPAIPAQPADIPQHIQKELTDLIQLCFPDMPGISADALAGADVMEVTRLIAHAHAQIFKSKHLRTDFVVLVLYGLMRQSLERLEEVIQQSPALSQAFSQSPLPWKPNDWRNKNA